jgi:membrane-associated protein
VGIISTTKKTLLVQEKYLVQSKDFLTSMGKSYYFARFLPIFRTFAPIVAGIVTMDKEVHVLQCD